MYILGVLGGAQHKSSTRRNDCTSAFDLLRLWSARASAGGRAWMQRKANRANERAKEQTNVRANEHTQARARTHACTHKKQPQIDRKSSPNRPQITLKSLQIIPKSLENRSGSPQTDFWRFGIRRGRSRNTPNTPRCVPGIPLGGGPGARGWSRDAPGSDCGANLSDLESFLLNLQLTQATTGNDSTTLATTEPPRKPTKQYCGHRGAG